MMPLEYDIPFETYKAWPGLHSGLLNACARSMLHGHNFELYGRPDTPALALGRIMHAACLEPDRWREQRCLTDECGRKSAKFAQFIEANPGRICATADEAAEIDAMCKAGREHAGAWPILSAAGGVEVSARWIDPGTGLPCKARFDKLGDGRITDIKTCLHAGHFPFVSSAVRYGYHRQAAHYLRGYRAATGDTGPVTFTLIAVEKTSPYAVAVYDLIPDELEIIDRQNQKLMQAWAKCRASGVYPGYCQTSKLLALPEYALHDDGPMPTFGGEEIDL
jgi:hypothetical protein